MKLSTIFVAAGLMAAVSAAPAAAQCTDCPIVVAGPAVTSTITFIPTIAVGGGAAAAGGTVSVSGPGGVVSVSAAAVQALNQAVTGQAMSNEGRAALIESFGGAANPQAGALVAALEAFGANPSGATLGAAVTAYNAAVNGGPATPPGGIIAARAVLSGIIRMAI